MSDLVVITFNNETDGPAALVSVRDAQKGGGLSLRDVAVVIKDSDGKIQKHNETDSTTIAGGVGGGVVGLLLGAVFFPIGGMIIGAAVGAAIGHSLHHNVDKQMITDVTNDLTPGTSALFVLVDANPRHWSVPCVTSTARCTSPPSTRRPRASWKQHSRTRAEASLPTGPAVCAAR